MLRGSSDSRTTETSWQLVLQDGAPGVLAPTERQGFRQTHNRSASARTRFPAMPDEQVLEHGIDAVAFLPIQFSVFEVGHVSRSANMLHFTEHRGRIKFQKVELFTHIYVYLYDARLMILVSVFSGKSITTCGQKAPTVW